MENKEQQKKKHLGNKGFSLVELIVVMAIMAILVGIVGAQVIPYIEKSKESKDYQVMGGFCSAAVSAYTELAEEAPDKATVMALDTVTDGDTSFNAEFVRKIQALTYKTEGDFAGKMKSDNGQKVKNFEVKLDKKAKKITVTPVDKDKKKVEAFDIMVGEL